MQLLTRLRLGSSHLNEHKFRHHFREFLNLQCECKLEPETTSNFLLRCHLFQVESTAFLNDIKEIDERNIIDNTSILDQILLYEYENYNHDTDYFLCKIKTVPASKTLFFLCAFFTQCLTLRNLQLLWVLYLYSPCFTVIIPFYFISSEYHYVKSIK